MAQCFFLQTAKALIRLGGCQGWSESSLGAQAILLVFSCSGAFDWHILQTTRLKKSSLMVTMLPLIISCCYRDIAIYFAQACSFGLPWVPFINCCQFMHLVISFLVLRAGCGIWLYQFLIIAYLCTLDIMQLFRFADGCFASGCIKDTLYTGYRVFFFQRKRALKTHTTTPNGGQW